MSKAAVSGNALSKVLSFGDSRDNRNGALKY